MKPQKKNGCRNGKPSFGEELCLRFFEFIFAYTAERAGPIFRQIFESGAGSDTVVGIADFGIIFITADAAYVLVHRESPFHDDC